MRHATRQRASRDAEAERGGPAATRQGAGTAFFDDRRPQAARLQDLARAQPRGTAGVLQRVREQVVVPRAKAQVKTGFGKFNIRLAPGDLLEVDFEQIHDDRVPVYRNGEQIGTIGNSAVSRKLVSDNLPEGAQELDPTVLDVAVLTQGRRGAQVQNEKRLVARYSVPEGAVLYHGTYADSVQSIQQSGLDPNYGGKSGGSDYDHWRANCKGYVYLSPVSESTALGLIKNFWLGQGTPEEPHTKKNLPMFTVLKITVPEGGLELEADPDLGGVSMRTKTLIEPAWISVASTTEQVAEKD
jgi:hypothetical protein